MPKRKQHKAIAVKPAVDEAKGEDIDEVAKKAQSKYSDETCPICGSRYDEKGMCACGAGAD